MNWDINERGGRSIGEERDITAEKDRTVRGSKKERVHEMVQEPNRLEVDWGKEGRREGDFIWSVGNGLQVIRTPDLRNQRRYRTDTG